MEELLKPHHPNGLKALGYHALSSAREKGQDTAKPLALVGMVTMAIGAVMLLNASRQAGRGV